MRLLLALFVSTQLTMNMLFAEPLRILYFTKSSGFEHSVIQWDETGSSHSERILAELGQEHGFEFSFSKDGSLFSEAYLDGFDVIMFYTSGNLTEAGNDGHPPMTEAGKEALLAAIAGGKGFVGIHSASDSFHTHECPGCPARPLSRYENYGEDADPYIRMIGGEFISHGPQQEATVKVVDRQFPGSSGLGAAFTLFEEWYSLKEFAPDLHTLLLLQTKGMEGRDYERPDFPLAWARAEGEGRVWFNAMGHREDVWENPIFQQLLVGGIEWAGGRKEASISPDLRKVAPGADVFPPAPEAD